MASLYQDSGSDNAARVAEMTRLLGEQGLLDQVEQMASREQDFIRGMSERLESGKFGDSPTVSPKMLFWARDLAEKYCR